MVKPSFDKHFINEAWARVSEQWQKYQHGGEATPHTAAMATASTWRWRGGCSNGIALLLYWFDTHRHTYARTAQIISPLVLHTQSVRQLTQGIIPPPHISTLRPPRREPPHTASDRIIGQANYSCANMYAPSSRTSTQKTEDYTERSVCMTQFQWGA